MTKKTISYAFLILLLSTLTVTNWSCEKIFGDDDDPEGTITAEKSSIKSGEVAMLIADFDITDGLYEASFNDAVITLNAIEKALYFVVPNVNQGFHNVYVDIDGNEFMVELNVIANVSVPDPDQYITDIENEITVLIQNTIKLNTELIDAGLMSTDEAQNNSAFWNSQIEIVKQELASLSESEKLEFAKVFAANRDWLDEFLELATSTLYKNSNYDCQVIFDAGKAEHEAERYFSAAGYALEYKFCKLEDVQKVSKYVNKINTLLNLWEPLSFMANAWKNITSPIIDWASKALGNNREEVVAEDIEDNKKTITTFVNNIPKSVVATIRYRTINQSDIDASNSFSSYASNYNQFIDAFARFLNIYPDNNIFPPSFANSTKSIPFNRFMEIKNLNNSNVILKSSVIVDDNWEVVFETNEIEDQQFTYDLVYNDGKTELSKTITATLSVDTELSIVDKLVQWGPWKSEAFQVEDGGYQYIIFTWTGSECYCLQGSWYWTSGILDTSVTLCFAEYTDEYTYTVSDNDGNDPCPPENQANADILKIVEITEDILKLDVDEGEIMIFTPIGN